MSRVSASSDFIARHIGLDWLRIAAFGLLMLHHVGRAFAPGDWLVKLGSVDALIPAMLFVTPWRLALLFLIAGYASKALLARTGLLAFLRERSLRLLLPLIAAMAVIVPPQSWVNLVLNHDYPHGFGHFLAHDAFAVAPVHGVAQPGWEHLWFVAYLFGFTVLTAAGIALAGARAKPRIDRAIEWLLQKRRLLWAPLLYFVPARVVVAFTVGESHGLFDDWLTDIIYLPCFLLGFALAGRAGLWPAIARCWRPALTLALGAYGALLAIELLYPEGSWLPHIPAAIDRAAMAMMMWGMILALLRLADTWLNRDHRWRGVLSEAVFPFYIIHQTIIVLAGWSLLDSGIAPASAFAIILTATAAGCWLFYRLGDLAPPLRILIGRKPRARVRARGASRSLAKLGAP